MTSCGIFPLFFCNPAFIVIALFIFICVMVWFTNRPQKIKPIDPEKTNHAILEKHGLLSTNVPIVSIEPLKKDSLKLEFTVKSAQQDILIPLSVYVGKVTYVADRAESSIVSMYADCALIYEMLYLDKGDLASDGVTDWSGLGHHLKQVVIHCTLSQYRAITGQTVK